jgi:hypothetical protein
MDRLIGRFIFPQRPCLKIRPVATVSVAFPSPDEGATGPSHLGTGGGNTTPLQLQCESTPTVKTNAIKRRFIKVLGSFPVPFEPVTQKFDSILSNPCAQIGTFSGAKTQLSVN